MDKVFFILFMAITFSNGLYGQEVNMTENDSPIVDHSAWDNLLKKYVSNDGNVDYKGFKKEVTILNNYIDYLATKIPSKNWSKQEKLAYYINLYNANTVKLIVDNYPVMSIKKINNPWTKKRIKIGDNTFSLSEIENDILRNMNEPRIHFAINCASASCPILLNTAYNSDNVMVLLEQAAKDFINNPVKNKVSANSAQISKIFKWYKDDFTKNGTLENYINHYSDIKMKTGATVDYLEYDWNLNEQH